MFVFGSHSSPQTIVFVPRSVCTRDVSIDNLRRAMNSIEVKITTIAGSGEFASTDGVGLTAEFAAPISYSSASGMLWISEFSDRIRAMQPASTQRYADVKRVVMATLFQSDSTSRIAV